MASHATQNTSRIPLPVKSSPTSSHIPVTVKHTPDFVDVGSTSPSRQQSSPVSFKKENGSFRGEKQVYQQSSQTATGKGFETFLMTGETIIHTNPSLNQKTAKADGEVKIPRESQIPKLGQGESHSSKLGQGECHIPKLCHGESQILKLGKAESYIPKLAQGESHIPKFGLSESQIPRFGQGEKSPSQHKLLKSPQQQLSSSASPKVHSKIPAPIRTNNTQQQFSSLQPHHSHPDSPLPEMNHHYHSALSGLVTEFPLVHAPVAEMEELSDDSSQSSSSESELGTNKQLASISSSLPLHNQSQVYSHHTELSSLQLNEDSANNLQPGFVGSYGAGLSDASFSEPHSSGDSGFVHDGHVSDPDLTSQEMNSSVQTLSKHGGFLSDEVLSERGGAQDCYLFSNSVLYPTDDTSSVGQTIVSSSSGEKFSLHNSGNPERSLVRTSKSHENYLQAGTNIALVNIDIDDNLAYSLDTLTYHDSPGASTDNVASDSIQTSKSLNNSPEKKSEKTSAMERDFIPGFINVEDSSPGKMRLSQSRDEDAEGRQCQANGTSRLPINLIHHHIVAGRVSQDGTCAAGLDTPHMGEEADSDSLYHQPSKAVDKPSAERLAKRLFFLEGFRKSDVSRHLCKKNDFSNLVAEEYLKFFDFQEDTLDLALRKFLLRFSLYGETQERERVLAHFSRRFIECNPGSFHSEDACHTLTCAIMLLNSDLHSPNVVRRMTCQEFIENLAALNDGENFSKEVLKGIYQAIRNEPIEWAVDEACPDLEAAPHLMDQGGLTHLPASQVLGSNPFLEVPDPSKTTEYKKGYVMRKSCMESDRRKTPMGKRGWKMMYAVLRDMILYQYKDEHQLKKGHFVESSNNAVRIHHSLATKALDYTKKQHVFRLQTADWAEYLFQTGDSKELQEWVDTINFVAASLSAPVLPGAVGSKAKFQRQLLPSSCTRLNLREQLLSHETKVQDLEQELHGHHLAAPEKGAKSSVIQEYLDKESYLEFEIKRFKTYAESLQAKLQVYPDPESSLVETTIGEYEEMEAGHSLLNNQSGLVPALVTKPSLMVKPVQRSLSDSWPVSTEMQPGLRRSPVVNELSQCTKL